MSGIIVLNAKRGLTRMSSNATRQSVISFWKQLKALSQKEAGDILDSDYLVHALVKGDWAYQVTFDGDASDLTNAVPLTVSDIITVTDPDAGESSFQEASGLVGRRCLGKDTHDRFGVARPHE